MSIKLNFRKDIAGVNEMITRTREAWVDEYRGVVWEIFCRILEQTPQFTGRAVAHWDIMVDGAGTPFQNDNVGKFVNMLNPTRRKNGRFTKRAVAQHKGNPEFIEIAKARNWPKLQQIHRGSVVQFVNAVEGDTDMGASSTNYMKDLQSESYWLKKLRSVNKPYEVVAESIALVQYSAMGAYRGTGVVVFRHTRFALGDYFR